MIKRNKNKSTEMGNYPVEDDVINLLVKEINNNNVESLIDRKVVVTKDDDSTFNSSLASIKSVKYYSKTQKVSKYQFKFLDEVKGNTFYFRIIKKSFFNKSDGDKVFITKTKYKKITF